MRAFERARTPLHMAADLHLLHDFLAMHRIAVEAVEETVVASYELRWQKVHDKLAPVRALTCIDAPDACGPLQRSATV
jgi:hypothetical protein